MEQQIQFEVFENRFNSSVTVVRIKGYVDTPAAPALERLLEELISKGKSRLLLDLRETAYMSSAGIGVISGTIKSAREAGGDIKLCHISEKILKIFQSIGLDEMLERMSGEEAARDWRSWELKNALDHFRVALMETPVFCGKEFRLRLEACSADRFPLTAYSGEPKLLVDRGVVFPRTLSGFQNGVWDGRVVVTDSGLLRLTVKDGRVEQTFSLEVAEDSQKAVFPRLASCPTCSHQARAQGMGIFRCAVCDAIFYVDAWAHVIALQPGSAARRPKARNKAVELKLNTDVNYLNSVRRFLMGICEQESLDEGTINEVVLAVEEALLNIIEHSHHYNPRHRLQISVKFGPRELVLRIRDQGDPYDITRKEGLSIHSSMLRGRKGGVGILLIRNLMDELIYRSARSWNELKMVKKLPRAAKPE